MMIMKETTRKLTIGMIEKMRLELQNTNKEVLNLGKCQGTFAVY